MRDFDEARFLRIQSGAAALAEPIAAAIGELIEGGSVTVNRPFVFELDGTATIDGIAGQIEDAAESSLADGDGERSTGIGDFHTADHAVGAGECDTANATAAEVLLDFTSQLNTNPFDLLIDMDGIVDGGEVIFREFGIEDRADDLCDFSNIRRGCGGGHVEVSVFLAGSALFFGNSPACDIV